MRFAAHPRLYISATEIDRLNDAPRTATLKEADRQVRERAETFADVADVDYPRNTHNEHLLRARAMQQHVLTLLTRWSQTGEGRYRDAVVRHIRTMGEWEYWSWITWRQGNPDPLAIYDLSYGENSATLAVAYTWLHDTLSDEERALFLEIARTRSLASFLHHVGDAAAYEAGERKPAWWFKAPQTNWNTVCAGGAGMLALAMHEDLPEAERVVALAEESIEPFMKVLDDTGGAWPEGIGYWNYGMRYAFMYLLSHENATGRKHPLLHRDATRATLRFPLAFCPNGVPCSFGDVNRWHPMPFHSAAADRLGAADVVAMLDDAFARHTVHDHGSWPNAAELLLLHPRDAVTSRGKSRSRRSTPKAGGSSGQVVEFYPGQDWGVLADRMPDPTRYLAFRGGTTEVPHGHTDLLSFHCVVRDEAMITNLAPHEYLDTTFSPRRHELFEIGPASKNALMVNGVGIARPATVTTTPVKRRGAVGYQLDASEAMGMMRDGPVVRACHRTFLMLAGGAFLIVDQVELPHIGRLEARLHTLVDVDASDAAAKLAGERQRLNARFAANVPATLRLARPAMTTPHAPQPTALRWCGDALHKSYTFATLLSPGAAAVRLTLDDQARQVAIAASGRGWQWRGTFKKPLA